MSQARCATCGALIPADAPGGQCPACLVQLAFEDPGTMDTATPEGAHQEAVDLPAVGPYRLMRLLGEGGMGLVYLAQQTAPVQRQVAVKVIKPGLASTHVLARFESERQALALLHHTGIAAVFDAGTTAAGQPFFAMEYVDGPPITRYCDEHRLPVSARIELFLQVCAAIQHAHQNGIIHRDLKPSNILVAQQDGRAIAKIIDFGVAKAIDQRLTERTAFTQQGILLGTPEYMSPEQAELSGVDVDARTDIYSLGLVLYELLVGVLPFDPEEMRKAGYLEILRIVREQESPRPTTRLQGLGKAASEIAHRRGTEARALARQLSGDLEWITLKALEKDRARRYSSAAAFADDVARYVKDEPVLAGRPGAVYRLRKYLRRHRTAATTGVAITTAVLAMGLAVWALRRPAPPTPRRAVLALTQDSGLTTDGVVSRDGRLLVYASDRAGGDNLDIWIRQLPNGEPMRLTDHPTDDNEPHISPDGKLVAFHSDRDGGGIYLIPISGGEAKLIAKHGLGPRFSPNGRYLAYWVGIPQLVVPNGQIYVLDIHSSDSRQFHSEFHAATHPEWSPDGQRILFLGKRVAGGTGRWDWWTADKFGGAATSTGAEPFFKSANLFVSWNGHPVWSELGIFFPAAQEFVGGSETSSEMMNTWRASISPSTWRLTGQPEQITFGTELEYVSSLRPDGSLVFSAYRSTIDLWQIPLPNRAWSTADDPKRLTNDRFKEWQPSISRDGTKLAFISDRLGNAKVWLKDLQSGDEKPLTSTSAIEFAPIVSRDGNAIAYRLSSTEGWSMFYQRFGQSSRKICDPGRTREDCYPLAVVAGGTRILGLDYSRRRNYQAITAFDTVHNTRADVLEAKDHIYDLDVSPDEHWIAFSLGNDGGLFVAPLQNTPPPRNQWIQVTNGSSLDDKPRWSLDGSHLYFISDRDGFICLWARKLDDSTKEPIGEPAPLRHFHSARRSLRNQYLLFFNFALARNGIVFNMEEHTGNIWTTVPDVPAR